MCYFTFYDINIYKNFQVVKLKIVYIFFTSIYSLAMYKVTFLTNKHSLLIHTFLIIYSKYGCDEDIIYTVFYLVLVCLESNLRLLAMWGRVVVASLHYYKRTQKFSRLIVVALSRFCILAKLLLLQKPS